MRFSLKLGYGIGQAADGAKQAAPENVDASTIMDLAILAGPVCMLLFIATIFISNRYDLSQQRHQEIINQIQARN